MDSWTNISVGRHCKLTSSPTNLQTGACGAFKREFTWRPRDTHDSPLCESTMQDYSVGDI